MNALIEFLRSHGLMLLTTSSVLLLVGSAAIGLQRPPIHRQRLGELTILCVLAWIVLACLPLPRWQLFEKISATFFVPANVEDSTFTATAFPQDIAIAQNSTEIVSEMLLIADQVTLPVQDLTPIVIDDLEPAHAAVPSTVTPTTEASSPPVPTALSLSSIPSEAHVDELQSSTLWAYAYIGGSALCAIWLLLGHWLLLRLHRASAEPEPWLTELYESLPWNATQRRPRLIVTRRSARAASWGIWRPVILLPREMCRRSNTEQLRHVLLHELGHTAQRDARGTLLFNLAFPLLYFHPAYWWLRSRVRLASELIADDWAARHSSREAYVQELIWLVTAGGRRLCPLGVSGIFHSPTQFYRRMRMLLEREQPLATLCSSGWRTVYFGTALVVVCITVAIAGVPPAEADSTDASKETTNQNETVEAAQTTFELTTSEIEQQAKQAADQAKAGAEAAREEAERYAKAMKKRPAKAMAEQQEAMQDQAAAMKKALDAQMKELEKRREQTVEARRGATADGTAESRDGEKMLREQYHNLRSQVQALEAMTKQQAELESQIAKLRAELAGLKNRTQVAAVPAEQRSATPTSSAAPSTSSMPSASPQLPASAAAPVAVPVIAATPARRVSSIPETSGSETLNLAAAYADALAAMELSRADDLEEVNRMHPGAVSQTEIAREHAKAKAAERKVRLLRQVAEIELQKTATEFEHAERLKDHVTDAERARLRAKLQVLKLILSEEMPKASAVESKAAAAESAGSTMSAVPRASRRTSATRSDPQPEPSTTTLIDKEKPSATQLQVFKLKYADAEPTAHLLEKIFREVTISADKRTNALVVNGPAERVAELQEVVQRLDEPGTAKDQPTQNVPTRGGDR